ncbi:MAG: hypothetical protein N2V72_00550 [Methanophagales archaeon]|nr:hypothetical protein [Methanophagales archaeon]
MRIWIDQLMEEFEDLPGCSILDELIQAEEETGENCFEVLPAERDLNGYYASSDGDVWDEEVEAALSRGESVYSIGDIEHHYVYGFIRRK